MKLPINYREGIDVETYMLSQIVNWRRAGAGVPAGFEVQAVVELVVDGWGSPDAVADTARLGVSDADRMDIADILDRYGLSCTVDECAAALRTECRQDVADRAARSGGT